MNSSAASASTSSPAREGRKVALVTGASRGIGAAIAERLAADGFAVVVNYAGRAADAEKVVAAIRGRGGEAVAVQANVAAPAEVAALFDAAERQFGGIDVVVSNAGVIQPGLVSLVDTDDALFDRIIGVNLKGTFNVLRLAAKRVRAGGRIITLSSSLVGLSQPGYSIYTGTKAAVEAFTRILAKELRGRKITVNCVAPGPTATDLFLEGKSAEQVANFTKAPPLERLGAPVDIAGVVGFLVRADAEWVNGQTIRANGGVV
ncbi:MAG TPA: SDR family oxidoreductase [Opitutaceae bacterium]|nr:SDR family oxidoreductase [Opitutaceae bacterium]